MNKQIRTGRLANIVKRKYDSHDSKRRLLKAGIEIFSKHGYDAATTRNIAKVAGVNDSLIHRYFETKLGLLFAIMREYHEKMIVSPDYPVGETLEAELRNYFRFRMENYHRQKKFMRLFVTRTILDAKVRNEWNEMMRNGTVGLLGRLQELKKLGKIRSDVSLELVSILVAGISFSMGMFREVMCTQSSEKIDSVIEMAIKVLSDGLK